MIKLPETNAAFINGLVKSHWAMLQTRILQSDTKGFFNYDYGIYCCAVFNENFFKRWQWEPNRSYLSPCRLVTWMEARGYDRESFWEVSTDSIEDSSGCERQHDKGSNRCKNLLKCSYLNTIKCQRSYSYPAQKVKCSSLHSLNKIGLSQEGIYEC